MLNVDAMDGVHPRDERGDAGVSEILEKRERAIDSAASRDPNDSMVAIRRTKPPIMGISSSSSKSSMVVRGDAGSMVSARAVTAADDRGWMPLT